MIEEASLYANLYVETSPVAATATWTNHIATVRDISLTRGGIEPYIGVSQVEVGGGTITLIENTATIQPGYWVRVRYSSTNIWAGYVQDVTTNYTLINGVQYSIKTLSVLDWVAWIAQWSVDTLDSANYTPNRAIQLNRIIDSTAANKPIIERSTGLPPIFPNYGSLVGSRSFAEILDLTSNSTTSGFWKATTTAPTGSISGIDSIIDINTSIPTLNVALTDGTHTGSPTNLTNYTDIQMATQTSQVSNNVVINNLTSYNGDELSTTYQTSDATSIATYGSRLGQFESNVYFGPRSWNVNRSVMPSFEGTDYELTSTNFYTSIEQPALDAGGAWSAYSGTNALRAYNVAGTGTNTSQGWNERINVTPGSTYYAIAYAATTGSGSIRARSRIDWYNEANTLLSTSYGSFVSLSSFKTWYKTSTSAVAPANAAFARVTVYFDRNGSTFVITTKLWVDGVYFGSDNVTDWFDGNTNDTATYLYGWMGADNSSQSYRDSNRLDTLANAFLTDNKTPKYSPLSIRLNAQANLTASVLLDVYSNAYVWFNSQRWTSTITGITHNISINADGTTRWMIDLHIRPSTNTI